MSRAKFPACAPIVTPAERNAVDGDTFAHAMPSSGAAPSAATSQKQLDIAAARAARKAVVGQNMSLTDEESKTFWPLYDEYEG